MTANTTFVSGAILTAAQMNALGWGVVDTTAGGTSSRSFYMKTNGNATIPTSFAQVPDLSMTFTPVTGRLYEASVNYRVSITTAQTCYIQLRIGATVYAGRADYVVAAAEATMSVNYVFAGLTSSTKLDVFWAVASTSTGSTGVFDANAGGSFIIKDIGPAT